jgi:energy-coupling factor transporter transmembrane protein EcfT
MFESRKSRVVARTTGKEQRWWIVSSLSVLMSRSFRMSDEVYQAMLARGFTGQIHTLSEYHITAADVALLAGSLLCSAGAIYANSWLL